VSTGGQLRLSDVVVPDTPAARAAEETVREFSPEALVNHCARSYVFAASLGAATGIAYDAELLYVAAMLHDLGLEPAFDAVTVPFEEAGGAVAWVFAAGAGWPAERREQAARAIVDHMRDDVAVRDDPEGHLLAVATSLDISGRRPDLWPEELLREAVVRFPRLDLVEAFAARFGDQAARKPSCAAAAAMRSGLAQRLGTNPLDRL
jgi:hypothetical protein